MIKRPITRRESVIDNYHGTLVADPYRWLENDTDPEVKEWVASQHGDFESYMEQHQVRKELKHRLTELWSYAKSSVPERIGEVYYVWRNNGIQNQSVLYRLKDLNDENGEMILDINPLSNDGTIAIMTKQFSPQGNYLAYGMSQSGSDWQVYRILDLKSDQHLEDKLENIKFSSITWLPDESGFFYTRYPGLDGAIPTGAKEDAARFAMICLHKLGTTQNQDQLVHDDKDHKDWNFRFSASNDGKWAFMSTTYSTLRLNQLHYKPLNNLASPWLPISADFSGGYDVLDTVDNTVYLYTQKDAPFGKIITVDLTDKGALNWQTVIPDQGEMLEHAYLIKEHLLCLNLHHASHILALYDLKGNLLNNIELPTLGTVRDASVKRNADEFFLQFCSFLSPDAILRYDLNEKKMSTWFAPKIDFPFEDYVTVQEFYPSKDGTMIPLFITKRKDTDKNGQQPTVLYGYGGYNSSRTPAFSVQVLAWLEAGGIHAEPCLRGGAEYGEAWHRAGMLESKQNTFDDFITAGEYLIREGYTCKDRLGIMGRSNGGLLTGTCVTQRPDLFGAAIVWVPVLDMLRYHHFTSGRLWVGEYGSADNPEQFPFLYAYSPLHNVKMNRVYPPTLIMTADTDDRVVPCQARKFCATIQAADAGDNPIYLRVEKSAGHGQGKPIGKLIDEQTDLYTFFRVHLAGAK